MHLICSIHCTIIWSHNLRKPKSWGEIMLNTFSEYTLSKIIDTKIIDTYFCKYFPIQYLWIILLIIIPIIGFSSYLLHPRWFSISLNPQNISLYLIPSLAYISCVVRLLYLTYICNISLKSAIIPYLVNYFIIILILKKLSSSSNYRPISNIDSSLFSQKMKKGLY